jgi:hypothetical protein
MVETAKANGLTPFDYLQHCLEQLALNPASLEHLLPWMSHWPRCRSPDGYYLIVRKSFNWALYFTFDKLPKALGRRCSILHRDA